MLRRFRPLIALAAALTLPAPQAGAAGREARLPGLAGAERLPSDRDIAEVSALERRLWEAWRQHDRATIAALSAPEYVNVAEDSVTGLSDILGDFDKARLNSYRIGPFAPVRAGPDVVILNYRADIDASYLGPKGAVDLSRPVSESSVWVRRGGHWLNLLLHETTVAPVTFPHAPKRAEAPPAKPGK